MITEFKIFEELIEDNPSPPKYKIGDYVEVNLYQTTDIMLITDIDTIIHRDNATRNDIRIYQYEGILEHNRDELIYVMEQYIIKKLTPEEAELYKNMGKYNL